MIVVDASVLAVRVGSRRDGGRRCPRALAGETLAAPELIDLEILSVFRRHVAAGTMTDARARKALSGLADLPMRRVAHRFLLARCWELRDTVTAYDAAYIALAEALDVTLVTSDIRLSRAPGIGCRVTVV